MFLTCMRGRFFFAGLVTLLWGAYRGGLIILNEQLGAFGYYGVFAAYAFSNLLETCSQMYGSSVSAQCLRELMDTKLHIFRSLEGQDLQTIQGKVGRFCLRVERLLTQPHQIARFLRISLSIRPDECIALVGPSRKGKSTLLSLDEPTSSLGAESEALIQEALPSCKALSSGR